jgi:hypothetical protein
MTRNFRKFETWQKVAKQFGAKTVRCSKSLTNEYWQARKDGAVIGFFNVSTGAKGSLGTLDLGERAR